MGKRRHDAQLRIYPPIKQHGSQRNVRSLRVSDAVAGRRDEPRSSTLVFRRLDFLLSSSSCHPVSILSFFTWRAWRPWREMLTGSRPCRSHRAASSAKRNRQ